MTNIQPPVQSYAAIDISGSVQGTQSVSQVTLDDNNTAYFTYPIGNTDLSAISYQNCSASNAIGQWQNGNVTITGSYEVASVGGLSPFDEHSESFDFVWENTDASDTNGNTTKDTNGYPNQLLNDGTICGEQSTGTTVYYADGSIRGGYDTSFTASSPTGSFSLPDPYRLGDSPTEDGDLCNGTWLSAAVPGYYCGNGQFSYTQLGTNIYNTNPQILHLSDYYNNCSFGFIKQANQITVFDPNTSWDHVTNTSSMKVIVSNFRPYCINRSGMAGGSIVNQGIFTSSLWGGTNFMTYPTDVYILGINDQNQVLSSGNVSTNYGEGYLWENGGSNTTSLRSVLSQYIQGQYVPSFWIAPYAISNQRNPVGNADTSINILSLNLDYGPGPPSFSALFHRDNTNHWTVYQQQFPTNVANLSLKSVNNQGLLAALGDPNSTGYQHALLMAPVELAVDANRDGTIVMASDLTNPANVDASGNQLPQDSTTQAKPFQFWINDGLDANDSIDGDSVQDSQAIIDQNVSKSTALNSSGQAVPTSNAGQYEITCTRDLQNFARLWMLTRGINSAIASGKITVGLEWHSNTGDAVNGWGASDGSPAINLYLAVPKHGTTISTGGADYLTDTNTANDQVSGNHIYGLGVVAKGQTPLYLPSYIFANLTEANPKTYFLFEGLSRGTGRLVITFNTGSNGNYTKIGEGGSLYMNLKDIKELYERWTVGDGPAASLTSSGGGGVPNAQAAISQDRLATGTTPLQYSSSAPGLSVPGDPNGNKYILFVHGWNMPPWDKDAFAETAFKRLYWQGYKGKFGTFEWPTTYQASGFSSIDALQAITSFDDGEYTSWLSAVPLERFLVQLNSQYGNNIFLLAHSHGNIVVAEALRLAGQAGLSLANTYVASQAAVAGQCYDPTLTTSAPLHFWLGSGPTTANIYNNWLVPPHASVSTKVNFFNVNDYALDKWNTDQVLKPDIRLLYYGYSGSPNDYPALDDFYKNLNSTTTPISYPLHLGNPLNVLDRYEIMAYDAEPRSLALGEISTAVAGFSSQNLPSIWPTDTYTTDPTKAYSEHLWHSGQFYFGNAEMQQYWSNLLGPNGFNLTP